MGYTIISLLLILVIMPICVGTLPAMLLKHCGRNIAQIYMLGFILMLATFQLIAVPIVLIDAYGFNKIVIIYTVIMIILVISMPAMAMIIAKKYKNKDNKSYGLWGQYGKLSDITVESWIVYILFFATIAFQIIMVFRTMSFDGDDAYYIAQSVIAKETGILYRTRPYTGLSTSLDYRHAMAVFPLWIAYISDISGLHPTIISHTILPIMLIPLTYFVYAQVGKRLLKGRKRLLPHFLLLISVLNIYGNTSIYTNSTFLLMRTWQGKSILANFILPMIIWILFLIFDQDDASTQHLMTLNRKEREEILKASGRERLAPWVLLFLVNMVSAMSSTSGVFLIAILVGVTGTIMSIYLKKLSYIYRFIIACLPSIIFGGMYAFLAPQYFAIF